MSEHVFQEIFRQVMGVPPEEPLEHLKYGETSSWDSIQHIKLIMKLKKVLGISFSFDELEMLTSYQGIKQVVIMKLSDKCESEENL